MSLGLSFFSVHMNNVWKNRYSDVFVIFRITQLMLLLQ